MGGNCDIRISWGFFHERYFLRVWKWVMPLIIWPFELGKWWSTRGVFGFPACFLFWSNTSYTKIGGLLKWGYIIHFNRIVHKPSSYWGTSILGRLHVFSWISEIRQSEGGLSDTVRQGHLDSRDVHDCVYYCIHVNVYTYIITYAYFSRGNIMKTCGIPNCALVHGKSII
jgi:hypothetical protein